MRVLVIGNVESIHMYTFSKYLRAYSKSIGNQVILDAIHIHSTVNKSAYEHYNRVYLCNPSIPTIIKGIPGLRLLYKLMWQFYFFWKINKDIPNSQTVLLQGFWKKSLDILNRLRLKDQRIVGSFWGSDFYRRNSSNDDLLQAVLDKCDGVIISTKEMEKNITSEFTISEQKIHNVLFGVAALDRIFEYQSVTKGSAKKVLNIEEHAFVITCGYCARPEMRHKDIIFQLNSVRDILPDNYLLLFPMTYSGSPEYIAETRKLLDSTGLRYVILDSFMSDDNVAHLRKATDVFIQIQTTDANSGSMQEHLVAQNLVITGSWLPYDSYAQRGVYFETIDAPNQLGEKVAYVMKNWQKTVNEISMRNQPDKFKSSLWSEVIVDWFDVLNAPKINENGK